jgi:hypothetical protein
MDNVSGVSTGVRQGVVACINGFAENVWGLAWRYNFNLGNPYWELILTLGNSSPVTLIALFTAHVVEEWVYMSVHRIGGTVYTRSNVGSLFLQQTLTASFGVPSSSNLLMIGNTANPTPSTGFSGKLTDLRVANQALYPPSPTPTPTAPLSVVTGTLLLLQPESADPPFRNLANDKLPIFYTPVEIVYSSESPF